MARHSGEGCAVDFLERRTLLSDAPFAWQIVSAGQGLTLIVAGTAASDTIRITTQPDSVTINDGIGDSTSIPGRFAAIEVHAAAGDDRIELLGAVPGRLYGDAGTDTLIGGDGNDQLFAGPGGGELAGGNGDDILVAVGDPTPNLMQGQDGTDSFWYTWTTASGQVTTDASTQEQTIDAVHAIPFKRYATIRTAALALSPTTPRIDLPDPGITNRAYAYQDFSDHPLFSRAGPAPDDAIQGWVGDCYLIAALSTVAEKLPEVIRQSIADMGDGTYAVRFHRGTSDIYVRVDGELPAYNGQPAYARLGAEDSIWVALIEKAYARLRSGGVGRYGSLRGGWMSEAFRSLGVGSLTLTRFATPEALLMKIRSLLDEGRAVTYASRRPGTAPLLSLHAYSVDSVILDDAGVPIAMRLRNPWGIDGAGNDGANDGYVTITALQAKYALWAVQATLTAAATSA